MVELSALVVPLEQARRETRLAEKLRERVAIEQDAVVVGAGPVATGTNRGNIVRVGMIAIRDGDSQISPRA